MLPGADSLLPALLSSDMTACPHCELQSILGEGASVVLDGQRVLPARAQAEGFSFRYQQVDKALRSLGFAGQ